ncbi:MAG: pyruvate kinase [Planctomycetia bacterium]|nr:pyruvate kinase [Planctomycetia bacterium]
MTAHAAALFERPSRTKIVATLGPASNRPEMLRSLIQAGVDIFRINAAHGTCEKFAEMLRNVREAAAAIGIEVGVLMDLGGPKIRLGVLPEEEWTFEKGSIVRFIPGEKANVGADGVPELTCTYEPLVAELAVGDRIVLADGTVELRVTHKSPENQWAACQVLEGGTVRSRQGVNLPGVKLSIPAMLEVDRVNAAWAAKNGVNFLGLSFVRHGFEIEALKEWIRENGGVTQVVAKIEKPEAVDNLLEIVEASDAVMVARGDLGVETDIATVPVLQKEIIRLCHKYRKPVIVATQMLESMTHNNFPTRAEVTDVANAILDGADACMLSGESAVGEWPVETVNMMHRVALGTESVLNSQNYDAPPMSSTFDPVLEATAHSVCELAEHVDAKFIIAVTASGGTALCLSANRCPVPILGLSHSEETVRRMTLYWGVIPMLLPAEITDPWKIMEYVLRKFCEEKYLEAGERVVLFAGTTPEANHNTIVVHEVK